jgi:hypothetical protein
MLDQPLDLLLDHLLGWQEHVLENVNQLRLQLGVRDLLAHFQNFNDGLLRNKIRQFPTADAHYLQSSPELSKS